MILKEIDNIKATYKALQNSKIREIKAFNIYGIVPKKVKKSKDVRKIHVKHAYDESFIPSNEYNLALKSCEYILEELRMIPQNLISIADLCKSFREKDKFLAELYQKTRVIPARKPLATGKKSNVYEKEDKTERQLLGNPPFY